MAEVKWIKITTEIFANRKIKQIEKMPDADSIIVIWFKLLCLAGEVNEKGLIRLTQEIPYTDEMLSSEFNKPLNTVRMALACFEKFQMIEIINSIYCISNWEKYQNVDKLEEMKEQTRVRVAKHREKVKLISTGCNVTCNADVTHGNALDIDLDLDLDIDQDKEKDISKKFHPPTLEEVKTYCLERKNIVDAQRFIDFYESKGWLIGKSKMKSWQAAVRTWERNDGGQNGSANPGNIKPADRKGKSELDGIDFSKFEFKG